MKNSSILSVFWAQHSCGINQDSHSCTKHGLQKKPCLKTFVFLTPYFPHLNHQTTIFPAPQFHLLCLEVVARGAEELDKLSLLIFLNIGI